MSRVPEFPPTFDKGDVHDSWEDTDPEDRDKATRYSIVTDMYHWCRPVFDDPKYAREVIPGEYQMAHDKIAARLREAGVTIPAECVEDHESGGFYIYFSSRKKAAAWIERLNAFLAAECEGVEDPAKALTGFELIHHGLQDPNSDYIVMGRTDLASIMETAEELDEKHGLGFAVKLKGLNILVEDYRVAHPKT